MGSSNVSLVLQRPAGCLVYVVLILKESRFFIKCCNQCFPSLLGEKQIITRKICSGWLEACCAINSYVRLQICIFRINKASTLQTKHVVVFRYNQSSFMQLFKYSICNFFRQELFLNVSAWDLACRQASLWLTHSSEWESFPPGGTMIPAK